MTFVLCFRDLGSRTLVGHKYLRLFEQRLCNGHDLCDCSFSLSVVLSDILANERAYPVKFCNYNELSELPVM